MSVLAENGLRLLELSPLLADSLFRASSLKNAEVREFFELRFNAASEAMQTLFAKAEEENQTADVQLDSIQASLIAQSMGDLEWARGNSEKALSVVAAHAWNPLNFPHGEETTKAMADLSAGFGSLLWYGSH